MSRRPVREVLGFVSPKRARTLARANVGFTFQTTGEKNAKRKIAKAPPPLFSQGAGCAGISFPLGSRGEVSLTNVRERSADRRWCGTPHPVARLAAKPVPSAEGNGLPITRTGAPIGASPRRFSLDLETAFWKQTGAPIRNALDSAEFFALRSSAPTSPLPDGPT